MLSPSSMLAGKPFRKPRLGRLIHVLIPSEKMKSVSPRGVPFEREFHEFLLRHFGGYTEFSGNVTGCWKQDGRCKECISHREYQVACRKRSQQRLLEDRLATLAAELHEESLFYAIGSDVYLIEPAPHQPA